MADNSESSDDGNMAQLKLAQLKLAVNGGERLCSFGAVVSHAALAQHSDDFA